MTKHIRQDRSKLLRASATFAMLSLALAVQNAYANAPNTTNFWYRDFLDFAQNKGIFKPGTTGIQITRKDGTKLTLPNLPMPDFSPVSSKGMTTSIGGAYTVTAKHTEDKYWENGRPTHHAIAKQQWGNTVYEWVGRKTHGKDFSTQRLNKFVVETEGFDEGVDVTPDNAGWKKLKERYGIDINGQREVIIFRAGTGHALLKKNGQNIKLGVVFEPTLLTGSIVRLEKWGHAWSDWVQGKQDFVNLTTEGDSGSALIVYDNIKKKWVILGTLLGNDALNRSIYNQWHQPTIDALKNEYTAKVELNGKTGQFVDGNLFTVEGSSTSHNRKDLSLIGGGTLTLSKDLDMGIGGLIFDKGHNYEVNGEKFSFKGAGVDIGEGSTVEWNVKGNPSDNLHKIGKGTLKVNVSQGNRLKVGNGTVELNAQQAFNAIYVTSGKATVKLTHQDALNKDNYGGIYFAKNGGTLDLNGYNFESQKIAANDIGAHITNSNSSTKSTVRIKTTDKYIYHGQLSGNLDLEYKHAQKPNNGVLVLDGGTDIKGDITFDNAKAVMQGHATTHAIYKNTQCTWPSGCAAPEHHINNSERPDANKYDKGYMISNTPSSFDQPDWETRRYRFGTLNLKDSELQVGRNSIIEGNIVAQGSTLNFGGDGMIYRDNDEGFNITGDGFGFKQNVIGGQSREDSSIIYYGDLTASGASKIHSWMPYMEASLNIDGGSSFISEATSTLNLREKGISVKNGSTVTLQDVMASGLKNPVLITKDETSKLTMRNVIVQDSEVQIRNATVTGALAAFGTGVVDVDTWTFQDDNLQSDATGKIRVGQLSMNGFNRVAANLEVNDSLTLNSLSHKNDFYGLETSSLTLGKNSSINVNFSSDSLSLNNFAFDKDYTLISAGTLTDNRAETNINFKIEGDIDNVTNQTSGNKITFQFHKKPEVIPPPQPEPEPSPEPNPNPPPLPDPGPLPPPEPNPGPTPPPVPAPQPTPGEVVDSYLDKESNKNASAIIEAIQSHNGSTSNKYQEVAFAGALNPDSIEQGTEALGNIVNRTDNMFEDLATRVDRQTMMNPVRSGITTRLASIRMAQYRGVSDYPVASNGTGDLSSIGRAMDLDNQHQSFYIDVTGGLEKKDGDKSYVASTGFGYDKVIRSQEGKTTVGALLSYGQMSKKVVRTDDDGDLYTATGYVNFERVDSEGPEFLSYLTLGHLKNSHKYTPEIHLGEQKFEEKHWMVMSSNALKYHLPIPSDNPKMRYAFKPMLLGDFGFMHSNETSSTFLKRDKVNDFTVDLGIGLEYDAYSPTASYSLQVTAKRNVYHSEDQVGISLANANGFINYDLGSDRAVLFQVNALTTQQITDDMSLDLMLGAGADTNGMKSLQGSLRMHWHF